MEESLPWPANATPTALVSPEQGHELTEDGGPKTSLRRIPARRAASSSLLSKLLSPTYEAEELEQERESATTRPTPVQVARSTDNFQNLQRGNGIVNSQHDHDRMTDTMAQTMRPLYASSQSLGDSPSSTASRFNITDMNLNHVNSLLMSHREFLQSSRLRGISLERTSKEKVMHSLPSETQSSNPGDTGLPNPPATAEDTSTTISSQPPTDGYRAQYRSWRDTHPGTLSEKAWSISEQGSGQDSDGQVEMSIAEALARVEPNTRSRKASHSLRFFKEGLPDEKFKKRDGKDCLRLKDKSSGIKTSATLGSGHVSTTTKAAGGISPGQRSATSTSGAHRDSSFDHQPENPSLHDSSGSVAPVGSDGTPDNQETSQQSENGPEKSGQAPKSLPTQLLDDLRKMHNLTPAAEKGSSFSKSLPLIDSERPAKSDVEVEAKEEVTEESVAEVSPTKERPDEDEEESSEEQISSALFVPHQSSRESRESAEHTGLRTHAPEDICDGERRGSSNEPEQWLVQHEIHPRESENKSPMIPSSARMSPTTSQPPSRTPSIYFPDVLSSTPESSYIRRPSDAGYSTRDEESSHTDDPEITPTEKSRSRAYMAKNHKELQSHEQTAKPPLEAIELIPYKHQVGGHTTMWRFSKRAVCKQLNNRENEFYETIEHFHPALLKFMPRCVDFTSPSLLARLEAEYQAR
jgi:inositol-hexakisphosphate kinase